MMPRCEGLPSGPCPAKRNDQSVRNGKGDLMLCKLCDAERHRMFLESKKRDGVAEPGGSTDEVFLMSVKDRETRAKSRSRGASRTDTSPEPKKNDINTTNIVKPVVFNELLMYTIYQRDRCNAASLISVIMNFFSCDEISTAKKELITAFSDRVFVRMRVYN